MTTSAVITALQRLPLERILTIGITGSGKSYQWLKLAKGLLPIGAKFRVVDTDNDIDYMLRTQFPELLPENAGNVYVYPAFDWPEYKQAVYWIQQRKLTSEQLNSMDRYLVSAYKAPIKPIDWVVVDKSNNAWKTVQDYFVGEVFGEDTGEYFLEVRKKLWAAGDIGKSGKKATSTVLEGLDGWKDWCLDQETEIMTTLGWKKYNELSVGEAILALDPQSWTTRWETLKDIHVGGARTRKMLRLEGASHSSLSTFSHRWIVKTAGGKASAYTVNWRTSETLQTCDKIPMCAPCSKLPVIRTYSDPFVEIVAWYITEGSRINRRYPSGSISQSEKHPGNVERIRHALKEEFGNVHERRRDWGVIMWHISSGALALLDIVAPSKCPTYDFLLKLTCKQLDTFIEVCLLGDGSIRGTGQRTFIQNRKDVVDAFEFACALRGIATRAWQRHSEEKFGAPDNYQVSVLSKESAWPVNAAHQAQYYEKGHGGRAVKEIVDHEGIVWCPVTPSGTWLAKRRGTIYFTGNSVINKLYGDWINPIVYRIKCHVYAAADVDPLDKNEKDPEILSLYGDLRIKAAGQKAIGGQMHTILLFIPGDDKWLVTTVKDRANRPYFKKAPLADLYMQYLVVKAGWPAIE